MTTPQAVNQTPVTNQTFFQKYKTPIITSVIAVALTVIAGLSIGTLANGHYGIWNVSNSLAIAAGFGASMALFIPVTIDATRSYLKDIREKEQKAKSQNS